MISKEQKKALRKLLRGDYPTAADVTRIADDIDLSIVGIDVNANINTVWDDVLDKASKEESKWKELVETLKDEMGNSGIDAILSPTSEEPVAVDPVSDEGPSKALGGLKKKEKKSQKKPIYKNHLLVIGINDYKNGIPVLNNAFTDAKRFHKVLIENYQFSEENTIVISNEDATRKKIRDTFKDLSKKLTPEDNLIFYFSGHGELDKDTGIGYWVPADAVSHDTSTYISNDTIKGYLKAMKVQHVVGIIDACFSGSMVLKSDVEVAERYYNIPSRWVMTSGVEETVPDGQPGRNSPFAKSLLAHLENNTEDVLGLSKLWLKFREGVVANSSQTPLCQPVQNTGHLGGEYFFLLKDAKIDSIPKSSASVDLTISRGVVKTDLESLKMQLSKLVATDEMEEVFEVLETKVVNTSSQRNTILINQASYNSAVRDNNRGVISFDNYKMSLARVRNALLFVIDNLEEDDVT